MKGSFRSPVAVALSEQAKLRDRVIQQDQIESVRYVAGLDVGPSPRDKYLRAAIVVLSFPDLRMADQGFAEMPETFPYIPGLLSYREMPPLLGALDRLGVRPDLLLCDGQGRAHPRRFGLACHLGVVTGIPSIGVAKSRLVGSYQPVDRRRGAWQPMFDRGEIIGAVLRTRDDVAPVFVSVGHRVSLDTAIGLVLACTPRYRLPETTRAAHRLASCN